MRKRDLLSTQKDLKNKKVIIRIDANVPIKGKTIQNDFRLQAVLPTIHYLLKQEIKQLIIISHLGRPKGVTLSLSLKPIQSYLEKKLKQKVLLVKDVKKYNNKTFPKNKIILLENIRFYKEEEKNNKAFAKKLASFGDLFVNEAFSVCHRAHASIVGIPQFIPSLIGFLLEKECRTLDLLKKTPQKPFVCLIAGGKPETKIKVIKKVIAKADIILIAGKNIYPFFIAAGILKPKQSPLKLDKSIQEDANLLWKKYKNKIVIPLDGVIVNNNKYIIQTTAQFQKLKTVFYGDIGPKTRALFTIHLQKAKTIYWNGPLGIYEDKKLKQRSLKIAKTIAENGNGIIGGGDTIDVVFDAKVEKKMKFISTGGGASLSYFAGDKLPGLEAIKN